MSNYKSLMASRDNARKSSRDDTTKNTFCNNKDEHFVQSFTLFKAF